jgi:hypothetical protein
VGAAKRLAAAGAERGAGGSASEGLLRDWPQINAGVQKHYGYAFQWFGLSVLVVLLYVWFQLVRRFYPAAAQRSPRDEPLSFAVHSLPDPAQSQARQMQARSGRWKMLAVLLVCAAPVLASYFTYYVLRPSQQRSYGELIAEQPGLPDVQAQTLDGRSVNLNSLKGQWLLLSTSAGDCGQRCQDHLYLQRQLRETLGREKTGWTGSGSSATSSPCLKKSCLLPSKP